MNTVEATKLISDNLKISPADAMKVMEDLYNTGYISYPRTETTVYNKNINLRIIVKTLALSNKFGKHAETVAENYWGPRKGN